MNLDNDYVSLRQASEMLGVSLKTVQLWVETGVLLSWKTDGSHNQILQSSIALILEERIKVEKDSPKQKPPNGSIKVVVVEDDPDLLRLLEMTFDHYPVPINLRIAKNGFEGLILIGQFKPSIAIIDLNMPKMDGFSMVHSILNTEYAPQKIIVGTALSPSDIAARGGLPENIEVLYKPYSLDALEKIILSHH
jgi:CheY-like chemotaxis protein